MAEDRIVKFCTLVDARSISLVMMTNCTPFVQHFTRFQLTVCSHGSSALAELLVNSSVKKRP